MPTCSSCILLQEEFFKIKIQNNPIFSNQEIKTCLFCKSNLKANLFHRYWCENCRVSYICTFNYLSISIKNIYLEYHTFDTAYKIKPKMGFQT